MRYKTSDLSKVLNVSANTIRRFAEKGYLCPEVDDTNQYRYFGNTDVEKVTYISKYRKIGFGHDEIAQMINADIERNRMAYEKKMKELDDEIARLQSLRHMVKDDINMMNNIAIYSDRFLEMTSVCVDYVTYKANDRILNTAERQKVLYQFMYDLPEIEYVYIFRKNDILNRSVRCEEAVAIRTKLVHKNNLALDYSIVERYPDKPSILKIIKLPLNFTECSGEEQEFIKQILFEDFFQYMETEGYELEGDGIGVKVGLSKENEKLYQYVVLGMPVVRK